MINFSKLPAPSVIEPLSYEQIYEERKRALIEKWPVNERDEVTEILSIESEPLTKLLQENAYRELILRQRINDAARGVLAAYAKGADLDNLFVSLGVTRKEGESDEEFLSRALLAPAGFSTAGPAEAYRYHALTAHEDVLDVAVDRPRPGDVRVSVLSKTSPGIPAANVLDAVMSALSADDVRPLSDTVFVEPAGIATYAVRAKLHIGTDAASEPVLIAAREAVKEYTDEQHKLGGEIRFSGLYAALHQAGVRSVTLLSPRAELESAPLFAPFCESVSIEVVHDDS